MERQKVLTFFDAWPAYSKVETTDCRVHKCLLRLFNSIPAAIPTMLAGGDNFFLTSLAVLLPAGRLARLELLF